MPFELVRRVVAEAAALGAREIIPSTMGEPLLYAHFDGLVILCREHDLRLNLTTNGTWPGRGARAWAETIVPATSDVKVSLNGATRKTQEAIMAGSVWDSLLDGIRTLVAVRDAHAATGGHRCRVTLQVTYLEDNVHELTDIVRLAALLGVDRVKGHHVWTHFDVLQRQSLRRSNEAVGRWNEAVAAARSAAETSRRPDGSRVQLDNFHPLVPGEDAAPGGPCPFLGQEAWVSAEGRFDPCCAPDELRRTLGDFGSLHEQTLSDVWGGPLYRDLVRTYRTRALCLGCNMRRPAALA